VLLSAAAAAAVGAVEHGAADGTVHHALRFGIKQQVAELPARLL
jgi:hypothetical protein